MVLSRLRAVAAATLLFSFVQPSHQAQPPPPTATVVNATSQLDFAPPPQAQPSPPMVYTPSQLDCLMRMAAELASIGMASELTSSDVPPGPVHPLSQDTCSACFKATGTCPIGLQKNSSMMYWSRIPANMVCDGGLVNDHSSLVQTPRLFNHSAANMMPMGLATYDSPVAFCVGDTSLAGQFSVVFLPLFLAIFLFSLRCCATQKARSIHTRPTPAAPAFQSRPRPPTSGFVCAQLSCPRAPRFLLDC